MAAVKHRRFQSYAEFWPFYLSQHDRRATRRLHLFGTALGIVILIAAIVEFEPRWLILALVAGYGFAWLSHALVERNRPATFTYPLWSLRGDLHMLWLWVTGRLEAEVLDQLKKT